MARNQPYDFSDDDDIDYTSHDAIHEASGSHSGASTSSPSTYSTSSPSSPGAHGTLGANGLSGADMELTGMGEELPGDIGRQTASDPDRQSPAQEAAEAATRTATRSSRPSSETGATPTSMAKKRGNQPR